VLDGPVDVLRDRWGIPFVRAGNEADLFRAQGWLHAADRSFQMDLLRRAGTGRLAEIVGEPGVATDRLVRTLGFEQHASGEPEMLDGVTRGNLDAYAEGVNEWLRVNRGRLPVEFRLLGYKPEPWKATDSLLATRLMALNLCGNWQTELARAEIAARCGDDVLQAIDADADSRSEFTAQLSADVLGELVTAARDMNARLGLGFGTGSNNWVIGPRRTASRGAIMANDPHLDLTLPSIWYEQVLKSPTFCSRGFTIPGVPGIVLGHNGTVAWGFTNSCVDVQDLYVEQVNADTGTYRDTDGADKPLTVRHERIKVKGGDTITMHVRATRRGPLLTDAVEHDLDHALSLRWDAIRPGRISQALIGMNRAQNFEQFREALRYWTAPAQNVVYADVAGNIGFQHAGEIPIRKSGNGTLPSDGADVDAEWTGTVPYDEAPWSLNPSADRIVTANDKLVDDDYPYFISAEWMNGYRGERIPVAHRCQGPPHARRLRPYPDRRALVARRAAGAAHHRTETQARDRRWPRGACGAGRLGLRAWSPETAAGAATQAAQSHIGCSRARCRSRSSASLAPCCRATSATVAPESAASGVSSVARCRA